MQVYILGETPQEKGLQLEALSEKILSRKGYTNLSDRQIAPGGHELDVVGEFCIPMVGDVQKIKVICECKAHNAPINTTDWLKFLGKIYLEEIRSNNQVNGCFISLSGVNGNVSGSYAQLKENKKTNIEIITGEHLYKILLQCFTIFEQERCQRHIQQQTNKRIINFALAYYDSNLYWVVALDGDFFTVLDKEGRVLSDENKVVALLLNVIAGEHIDLKEEKERLKYTRLVESNIYSAICLKEGNSDKNALFELTKELLEKRNIELSTDVFEPAFSIISDYSFFDVSAETITVNSNNIRERVSFLKHVLSIGVTLELLSSNYFQSLIDEDLLNEITKIQFGIEIPPQERTMCIKVLQCSPSALSTSLNEMPLITQHRQDQPEVNDQIQEHDNKFYLRIICEKLIFDYDNPALKPFYFSTLGIEEIDIDFTLKAKTKNGVYIEHQNRYRQGIGQLADAYGGGLIKMLTLNDAPEPWERHNETK